MWYILTTATDDIQKKYVDPEVCAPHNRAALKKVQVWPNGKRKFEVKLKKEKKTVIESGKPVEVDGDIIDKV